MASFAKEAETNLVMPPTSGADICAPKTLAFSAGVSTSALDLVSKNTWVTLTASEDCYIRFSDVSSLGAATTSDWPLWKGAYFNTFLGIFQYIRVMGGANAGTLWVYQSSR